MRIGPDELSARYATLSDEDLFRLAATHESLTPTAQAALRTEFSRRDLPPPLEEQRDALTFRQLVTVHRYRDLSEALVARTLLESAGLNAFLCDENLVRLEWQISNFIGGIRLQVDVEEEQAAIQLLAQLTPDPLPMGEGQAYEQPLCPACASTNITFEGASRTAALLSLYALSIPMPTGAKTWSCANCGARWTDTEET